MIAFKQDTEAADTEEIKQKAEAVMEILKKEGRHDSAHDVERVANVTIELFVYRQDLWMRKARTIKSQVTQTHPLPTITILLFNYLDMQRRPLASLNNPTVPKTEDARLLGSSSYGRWMVCLPLRSSLIEPEVVRSKFQLLLFCEPRSSLRRLSIYWIVLISINNNK